MAASEAQLKDLMARSFGGDRRAHEELLRLLAPMLRSYFGRRVRVATEEVDDLVQEALIAIHTRRATYDLTRPLLPWVYAIAKYKLFDYFRRTGAAPLRQELHETDAIVEFEGACSARMDISAMLESLPEKQRLAIEATRIKGDTISDVAEAHGWSESDIKVSVHRGLKTLAARFGGAKA